MGDKWERWVEARMRGLESCTMVWEGIGSMFQSQQMNNHAVPPPSSDHDCEDLLVFFFFFFQISFSLRDNQLRSVGLNEWTVRLLGSRCVLQLWLGAGSPSIEKLSSNVSVHQDHLEGSLSHHWALVITF